MYLDITVTSLAKLEFLREEHNSLGRFLRDAITPTVHDISFYYGIHLHFHTKQNNVLLSQLKIAERL